VSVVFPRPGEKKKAVIPAYGSTALELQKVFVDVARRDTWIGTFEF
jgi:predicted methyltransferase MtxX (methanogen marker protein 4)